MEHYEILFIVSNKIDESQQPTVAEKVREVLTQAGASITAEDVWGKRRLAYPIHHEQHGYYVRYEFDLEPSQLKQIDPALRLLTEVVRFMIVKKHIKSEAELADEQRARDRIQQAEVAVQAAAQEEQHTAEPSKPAPVAPSRKKKEDESKIKLEDLDKKLDEILKEDV